MKKQVLIAAALLVSASAFAGEVSDQTGGSTYASIFTTSGADALPKDKELMIAAHDDALEFLRSEGVYHSALLDAAFESINARGGQNLTDVQKAQYIIESALQ